jgi:hypothetical protein
VEYGSTSAELEVDSTRGKWPADSYPGPSANPARVSRQKPLQPSNSVRIKLYSKTANVEADKPLQKVSEFRAAQLVADHRAFQIDPEDITKGIQLREASSGFKTEARGSREQSGSLTAYEAQLNAEYHGSDTRSVGKLSAHYEMALDKHIRDGRKGLPRKCGTIAARVKTILSTPTIRFA